MYQSLSLIRVDIYDELLVLDDKIFIQLNKKLIEQPFKENFAVTNVVWRFLTLKIAISLTGYVLMGLRE